MLDRLTLAFHQHSRLGIRREGSAADLEIEHISAGSLLVLFRDVLEVTSAFVTIYEHRELLGGFVAQHMDAATMMRSGAAPPSDVSKCLKAMAEPVRSGRATQVTLNVVGDNNKILIIDQAAAAAILAF